MSWEVAGVLIVGVLTNVTTGMGWLVSWWRHRRSEEAVAARDAAEGVQLIQRAAIGLVRPLQHRVEKLEADKNSCEKRVAHLEDVVREHGIPV